MAEFKSNLEKISCEAVKFSDNIVFLGLLPCLEETARKSAEKHQWVETYDNDGLRQYNQAIKSHCMKLGHSFVDIYPAFSENDCDTLLSDGLHPNSSGHCMICDLILREINSTG
jgi:lysophospholipase L1-like esterase